MLSALNYFWKNLILDVWLGSETHLCFFFFKIELKKWVIELGFAAFISFKSFVMPRTRQDRSIRQKLAALKHSAFRLRTFRIQKCSLGRNLGKNLTILVGLHFINLAFSKIEDDRTYFNNACEIYNVSFMSYILWATRANKIAWFC